MASAARQAASWYPGSCSINFTHAAEPLILPAKNGPKRALSELCKDVTPPCNLNPFLFNGHLQTGWTAMKYAGPRIHYKRHVFKNNDPVFEGHFAVDIAVKPPPPSGKTASDGGLDDTGLREDPSGVGHSSLPPRTTYFTKEEFDSLGSDDTKPLLISLHGLSGGSHETYLRQVLAPLVAQTEEGSKHGVSGGDWEALVVISRGCAGSKLTTPILYNARATWDIRHIVKWAREIWPNRPIFGIGYSLGANIITNYVAEEGNKCILSACVAVSNPFNLQVTSCALKRSYIGMSVYSKSMGAAMKGLYNLHKDDLKGNTALDDDQIQKAKYLHEFDREVQCASWGYPTEDAYYRDASSTDGVLAIRIPYFAIHARDDPIAFDEALPYHEIAQNPYTVLCVTSGGGHLSWFEYGGGRWHAKPIANFLNTMWRDIDLDALDAAPEQIPAVWKTHKPPFTYDPNRRKAHLSSTKS